jgi:hypothetical protein
MSNGRMRSRKARAIAFSLVTPVKTWFSGRHEAPSKGNPFRFVTVEENRIRLSVQDRGKFPRQVYGISNARIHALSTDGTVNVCSVAEQKLATFPEPVGDSMMHAISRKPVHAPDVDAHPLDHRLANVAPRQILVLMLGVLAYRANESSASLVLQREHGEKIGPV